MNKQAKSKEIETLYHKAKSFKTEAATQVEARKFWDAEKAYSKAMDIYAELVELAPSYRLEFTRLLNDAGNVSHELRQYSDAKNVYEQSLEIYHDLSREDQNSYQHNIAKTLNNLANVLVDLRDYTPAKKNL